MNAPLGKPVVQVITESLLFHVGAHLHTWTDKEVTVLLLAEQPIPMIYFSRIIPGNQWVPVI